MHLRVQRLALVGAATVVLCALAAMQGNESAEQTFLITFGLQDQVGTDWSGRVSVRGGEAARLAGWAFEDKDTVEGKGAWKCRTHAHIAPKARFPLVPPSNQEPAAPMQPWPNGVVLTVRGADPAVTVTLAQGEIKFQAGALLLGAPQTFLDGRVRIERLPETRQLRPAQPGPTEGARQDDYPAFWVRYKTGVQYLAWVAYHQRHDRVLLVERNGPEGAWSEPLEVAGRGDHFRVALATTHDDTLWIVWISQQNHEWHLQARPYRAGKLGAVVKLTEGHGPNLWHRMTTDHRGRAWLVWQGFGAGRAGIFARCVDSDGWHSPVRISAEGSNNWDPVVAADYQEDRVWVGWDSYANGNYGVRVRSVAGGPEGRLGAVLEPEASNRFQAHVSLACDRAGRVWAAWDESGPQWGKDTGFLYSKSPATRLYQDRRFRIKCLADGRWLEPEARYEAVLPPDMQEYLELPQLQDDSEGRLWVMFRHRTCWRPRVDGWAVQGWWDLYATAFLGDRWLPVTALPDSTGRNDMRASTQRDRAGNVYVAFASDHRRWARQPVPPRNLSIAVSRLNVAPRPAAARLVERQPAFEASPPVHPREREQVDRIRRYAVQCNGKTYHIYRGDLHRHTDISPDGVGDGSLMDLHRYALDAAALDFVLVGDHNMGADNEYSWWRTQKANDLYTVPGAFISMYGYERSVPYPNGHRNVIWVDRGHRTLPVPLRANRALMAADTAKVYGYLRQTDGICTLHTSATDQGTDWEEHDNTLEPFVELFQGYHVSYEAPGAPKTGDERTDLVHGPYKPQGYVSHALEKGYRLGFQASSDHISTHVSYACVLAKEFTRQGLVDGMRKRHTYAATDNIVLDVRMGALGIMGDEVHTDAPRLDIVVFGTGPLDRIEVLRNGSVVHTEKGTGAEARVHWEDPAPLKSDRAAHYYVRVRQQDGQMAWSSPIWVVP
jgi:hypothetical protein